MNKSVEDVIKKIDNNNIAIIDYRNEIRNNKHDVIVDCVHRLDAAIVDASGTLLYGFGNVDKWVIARSSLKPIQALSLVESGAADAYAYTDADIALVCSSHNGEMQHVSRVRDILGRADIPLDCILTGGDDIQQQFGNPEGINEQPKNLRHNCSGKHSGMLTTAKFLGEDIATYPAINHPIQQTILQNISDITTYPKADIALSIDGCGVPIHAFPLRYLAHGFARMTDPYTYFQKTRAQAIDRITAAMMKHPEMVGGKGRFCTEFMATAKGAFFGKLGAGGIYIVGDMEHKLAIAIKIESGVTSKLYLAIPHIIKQLQLDTKGLLQKLEHFSAPKIYNARKEEVGYSEAFFTLKKYA